VPDGTVIHLGNSVAQQTALCLTVPGKFAMQRLPAPPALALCRRLVVANRMANKFIANSLWPTLLK
jgi:hypothetical protein